MVQKSPVALVPTIFLLWVAWVDADTDLCRRCPVDSELLHKTKLQVIWNRRLARKLYVSYVTHTGLRKDARQLCEAAPAPWFPSGNITRKPDGEMLDELYGTLRKTEEALALIQEQQSGNNPLLEDLERAALSVAGLLQNVQCALCLRGVVPTRIAPVGRTRYESLFRQRTDRCRILRGYSKFIARLAKGFNRQLKKGERPGRPRRRSGRGLSA